MAGLELETELRAANFSATAAPLDVPAQVAFFNQNFTTAGGTCVGSGNLNVNVLNQPAAGGPNVDQGSRVGPGK